MNKATYDDLYRLYVDEQLPMHRVAKELGIAVGSVFNCLKKYSIETRPAHMGFAGKTHTEAARQKMSAANRGKVVSEATRAKLSASKSLCGRGHKKKRGDGYVAVYFPKHPKSSKSGYVMEHILVMEGLIGRHLRAGEVVHHINRVKHDNRAENLQLMTASQHAALHMKERREQRRNSLSTAR